MGKMRRIALSAALALAWAAPALAEPLNLRDPTPREIRVMFENSGPDAPGTLDQRYGQPVRGWVRPGPGHGQALVRIPGSELERVISHFEPVPGTFSDFVWIFDIATGHVRTASLAGIVKSKVSWGFFESELETSIVMELDTRKPVGFLDPVERMGHNVYRFCEDGAGDCNEVLPVPYDSATGYVNAVGSVNAVAVGGIETKSYSPMGEARFMESTTPTVSAGPTKP